LSLYITKDGNSGGRAGWLVSGYKYGVVSMKIFRWLGMTLLTLAVVVSVALFGARFADGPIEIVSGGPFSTGEKIVGAEPDWRFLNDKVTVEFQLEKPARSRTTWVVELDGKVYIASAYMTTSWGKIWKQWPLDAEKDGRAILRVDGKLYDRQMIRITEGPEVAPVLELLSKKYNLPSSPNAVDNGYVWLFWLAPRKNV